METRYIDVTETAKLVRVALRRAFPGVKFSARSSRYAGGASIDVRWTDGPAAPDVQAVLSPYASKGFDGSIDMAYHYSAWLEPDGSVVLAETSGTEGSRGSVPSYLGAPPSEDAELVSFGAHYVRADRRLSDGFVARALATAERGTSGGLTCGYCHGGIPSGEPIILADGRCYHDTVECARHAVTYRLSAQALDDRETVAAIVEATPQPRPCLAARDRT